MSSAAIFNVLGYALLLTVPMVLVWALNRRRLHGLFRKHGIPGPDPDLFWGNWKQLKRDRLQVLDQWVQKYGKVFGFFMAEHPYMVVADLDLIHRCFVKESATFQDRPQYVIDVEPFTSCLLFLRGEEWKKVRNVLNPSFTTGKVKLCSAIVSRCTDELVRVLKTHHEQSEPVDLLQVAQGYSLDAITKIAMAWKVNCQQKTDDPLLIGVKRLLEDLDKAIVESSLALPGIRAVLKLLYPLTSFSNLLNRISENVLDTVKSRRQDQSLREKDMLQMMLDAQAGTEDAAYDVHKSGPLIEDRHLVSNSIILLLAGFETTAVTLGFALYLLAMHPEEQERVHTEMEDLFSHANELTFDDVHQLKRLDMVIRETLRLYPPVPLLVARTCLPDKTVMGQFIPAGTTLIAPAWHIHRNPEYWPEPSRFLPERFAEGHPERHPMAYFPFGIGPRTCIGRRLALIELKMSICKILRDFKLVPCEESQYPVPLVVPNLTLRPGVGLRVRLEMRRKCKD
ncbi:cytochrome P450 3A4-like [Ixodes scapularis]